jgi:hypothetical protein
VDDVYARAMKLINLKGQAWIDTRLSQQQEMRGKK